MRRKRLNIGIDIDGTLTHPGYFIPHLNRHFDRDINFADVRIYDFGELYNVSREQLHDLFVKNQGIMFEAELLEGAKNTVLELAERHNVHIITACDREIHLRTRNWLDRVGLSKIELHSLGSPNKAQFAKELQCDLFFEDHPTASKEIAEHGIGVLLMDAPYNRDTIHHNIHRVYNWQDIRAELVDRGALE